MEERRDEGVLELPPAALHELAGRISGIDEFRGWWQGRGHAFPSVLPRLQEGTIGVSTAISPRRPGAPGTVQGSPRQVACVRPRGDGTPGAAPHGAASRPAGNGKSCALDDGPPRLPGLPPAPGHRLLPSRGPRPPAP